MNERSINININNDSKSFLHFLIGRAFHPIDPTYKAFLRFIMIDYLTHECSPDLLCNFINDRFDRIKAFTGSSKINHGVALIAAGNELRINRNGSQKSDT